MEETFFQDLNIFQTGHSSGSETIFTNWEQCVANVTWNWRKFLLHSIAQSSASISAWRSERLARTFLAPNSPSNPSRVLNQSCPEKISFSFQEPSVKHHYPGIDGRVVTSMFCTFLCSFNICTSAQNVDYVSAKLSVSLGLMSILLKTLLFIHFQIYHSIHTNWWLSICGKTLPKRWSIFVNSELVGKIVGFDGIFERAQTWSVGGHSKNTCLSIPHRLRTLYNIYPHVSLSLSDSSLLLYILSPIAIENVLSLVDTVFSSRTLSIHQPWVQTIMVVCSCLGKLVLHDILI